MTEVGFTCYDDSNNDLSILLFFMQFLHIFFTLIETFSGGSISGATLDMFNVLCQVLFITIETLYYFFLNMGISFFKGGV